MATSIFAMVFYTVAGAAAHGALGHVDIWPTLLMAGIGLFAGAQIGAKLSTVIGGAWIMRLLALLLLVMGARLVMQGFWR